MEQKEMCTVACKLFEQKMNFPVKGQYSGLCDGQSGRIIYTEDVAKYDRYGTAKHFPCIAPDKKQTDENFTPDPFGWMTTED